MAERISPTGDLAFKKVFASDVNKDILQGFIHDFFGIRPELGDITITSPYSIREYKELMAAGAEGAVLRGTLCDVSADIRDAEFSAEIQLRNHAFYDERSVYYAFDRFCGNYNSQGRMETDGSGRPIRYSSLRPVYTMNILGHIHFPGDGDALRVFTLYDPVRGRSFERDLIKLGYFELGKKNVETENQRSWQQYFETGEARAGAPDYIRKACAAIEYSNLGREEKDVADMLQKARDTYQVVMYTAFSDGRKEGLDEGHRKGLDEGSGRKAEEVARKALASGLSADTISAITGLTAEEVEALRQ